MASTSQRTLCHSVLERLAKAGVLEDIVVIGSWCLEGYKSYFGRTTPLTTLRTRDIDFLVPRPTRLRTSVDVPALHQCRRDGERASVRSSVRVRNFVSGLRCWMAHSLADGAGIPVHRTAFISREER